VPDGLRDVQAAIGVIYQPPRIRRLAKAEVQAMVIRAEAELEIGELRATVDHDLRDVAERALRRMGWQEGRRQGNIDAIVALAARTLPPSVSKKPVDPDWTNRFVESAQDVAEPELHELWAKTLAQEVAAPGTVSRRTLSVLRDLSR
jgi:hypothetical protein